MYSKEHKIRIEKGKVILVNAQGLQYPQVFATPEEVDEFIAKLLKAKSICWISDKDIKEMADTILLDYLQYWGRTSQKQVDTLNEAVKFVGLNAVFIQQKDKCRWEYDVKKHPNDGDWAEQFRKDIKKCWPIGSWEAEHSAIVDILKKYIEK